LLKGIVDGRCSPFINAKSPFPFSKKAKIPNHFSKKVEIPISFSSRRRCPKGG
jgi:hypothetical protein